MVLWHGRSQKIQHFRRFLGTIFLALTLALALSVTLSFGGLSWLPKDAAQAQSPPDSGASVSGASASSNSLEDLQRQRDQLDQQREAYSETEQRYQKAEDQANESLQDLSKTIQSTDSWITNAEYQLAEAERKLVRLEADLEANQQDYERARMGVVGRLQFMQRQQGAEGWALLLQSQNLNDFLDRRYRLKQVYEADRATLVSLEEKSAGLVAQQQGIEQQKNAIALLRQQLLVSRDQYTAQAQQQSELMSRLQENKGALAAAVNQLETDSDEITALILERLAVSDSADEKISREEALRTARASGRMIKPTDGPITSNFGNRYHPVLGYSRFHAGTDFGAATGTPIRAAETGIVIFAGWYGGYGNAVILDHGDRITTLYGHASRLYVAEGNTVRKGETIAAIGTTGLSTGPHLHFEVRRAGEPVDPLNYL
ncbi:MAG: peptidoglycan DD-metalloendopeptidase family protein [Phormidesmis sp.]